ncbi:D-arabinono-1,4-lactone oxidase [Corynebacterium suicordis]|uniref:FAD-binding protein n=1 Tax=Corynebacterium suicordis DSM 45110 TaxID=1121369 RepID=A0ABR9ZK64_9CORY|nr:D-arabinono-1,4-lactone oxidase [Corynebacterium suicordis]MBF4553785.1 FAD-binding protein [Corynebacterium suicordis DSM 45110]MDR6277238.1 FAD-linked oxidoreductase [Corynebacterium suicordis]
MARATWNNWSGSVSANPKEIAQPRSEAELVKLIQQAATTGSRVKAVGAGHSFMPLAETAGVLVNLDNLSGLVHFDRDNMTVTLHAGTRLRDLPELLRPLGVALANQGDVDPQSIVGAISTGTHGTGVNHTGFAGMLRSFRIITADGSIHDAHPNAADELDRELYHLGRISLGALGIITQVEMDVVPTFVLEAKEAAEPLGPLVDTFSDRAHAADHLEFYWFPHTKVAHVKTNTRRAADVQTSPIARWQEVMADELLNNVLFGAMNYLSGWVPSTTRTLARISASTLAQREYSDAAHDVFVSQRRVRFNEMEYSVPLADATEVLKEVQHTINTCGEQVLFPIEVRATSADDVPLSTAKGRESCYIAVHRHHPQDQWAYFRHLEPIFKEAEGRPHWGKLHTLGHEDLLERHEDFAAVTRLRAKVDPEGVFVNPLLERMFGLV